MQFYTFVGLRTFFIKIQVICYAISACRLITQGRLPSVQIKYTGKYAFLR